MMFYSILIELSNLSSSNMIKKLKFSSRGSIKHRAMILIDSNDLPAHG